MSAPRLALTVAMGLLRRSVYLCQQLVVAVGRSQARVVEVAPAVQVAVGVISAVSGGLGLRVKATKEGMVLGPTHPGLGVAVVVPVRSAVMLAGRLAVMAALDQSTQLLALR